MADVVERVAGAAALSEELAATIARLRRSVVQVRAGRGGIGSGVIWRAQAPAQADAGADPVVTVVTNEHVVRAAGDGPLALLVADGRTLSAEVFAHDPEHDLALLRLRAAGLEPAEVGDSAALRVGELVIAVGNPFGQINRATVGIVAARAPADPELPLEPAEPGDAPDGGDAPAPAAPPASGDSESPRRRAARTPDLIQADVALYPGNSGGPLADARGHVVGINSMVGGGLAFAVPSRAVQQLLAIAGDSGHARPRLGVQVLEVELQPAVRARAGLRAETAVLVTELEPEGPAAAAGVLVGDLLIGVDGRAVATPRDLLLALGRAAPNGPLTLAVLRGGERRELALPRASDEAAA